MADPKVKERIESALLGEFSGSLDRVHVFDGYQDNVHAWVASPSFKDTPDYIRQDRVWKVLEAALSEGEIVLVSLVMTFDVDEPEYRWALRDQDMA